MLAPLKDRSVIEGAEEPSTPTMPLCDVQREMEDLRHALRDSRQRLRRGAWQSTRQISLLNAEVIRLQALCTTYEQQLERYSSGVAIIELGQALMRQTNNNERLKSGAHQAWLLEKTLAAAHGECQRLAAERDILAQELHQIKLDRLSDPSHGGA